jgi:hypothetical protein
MEQQVWSLQRARRSTVRPRVAADNQLCDLVSQCHFKKVMHRVWTYFHARLAFTVSSLPIMEKGEQFLRVIGIFTLYVATIKLAYYENNP